MDIKKLKYIADFNELDIIDKIDCLLINSYKAQDKYKLFCIEFDEEVSKFYEYFINELLKNIRCKNFFEIIKDDPKGFKELFEQIGYLTGEYGKVCNK